MSFFEMNLSMDVFEMNSYGKFSLRTRLYHPMTTRRRRNDNSRNSSLLEDLVLDPLSAPLLVRFSVHCAIFIDWPKERCIWSPCTTPDFRDLLWSTSPRTSLLSSEKRKSNKDWINTSTLSNNNNNICPAFFARTNALHHAWSNQHCL